jgi:hypothetical protein
LNRSGLWGRVAKLEGTALANVTLEEMLDRLERGEILTDRDFDRRLAASPFGRFLADLTARLPDEEQDQ